MKCKHITQPALTPALKLAAMQRPALPPAPRRGPGRRRRRPTRAARAEAWVRPPACGAAAPDPPRAPLQEGERQQGRGARVVDVRVPLPAVACGLVLAGPPATEIPRNKPSQAPHARLHGPRAGLTGAAGLQVGAQHARLALGAVPDEHRLLLVLALLALAADPHLRSGWRSTGGRSVRWGMLTSGRRRSSRRSAPRGCQPPSQTTGCGPASSPTERGVAPWGRTVSCAPARLSSLCLSSRSAAARALPLTTWFSCIAGVGRGAGESEGPVEQGCWCQRRARCPPTSPSLQPGPHAAQHSSDSYRSGSQYN